MGIEIRLQHIIFVLHSREHRTGTYGYPQSQYENAIPQSLPKEIMLLLSTKRNFFHLEKKKFIEFAFFVHLPNVNPSDLKLNFVFYLRVSFMRYVFTIRKVKYIIVI